MDTINIIWLYPDILNLHGDRGNLMAFERIARELTLPLNIIKVEGLADAIPWEQADLLMLCSGEVKNMPPIIAALHSQQPQLDEFIATDGAILALGSSGAVLGQETKLSSGSSFKGLGLLPMNCQERTQVYGDDLWFSANLSQPLELIGSQIQVLDTQLSQPELAFGQIIYGHGNNGSADEGCHKGNIIFTNTLGPLLVKNPRLAEYLLNKLAAKKGLPVLKTLSDQQIDYPLHSAQLIRGFIKKKMA